MRSRGACVVGWGVHGRGACVAGKTATAADGMHPTGMHSCTSMRENGKGIRNIIIINHFVEKFLISMLVFLGEVGGPLPHSTYIRTQDRLDKSHSALAVARLKNKLTAPLLIQHGIKYKIFIFVYFIYSKTLHSMVSLESY